MTTVDSPGRHDTANRPNPARWLVVAIPYVWLFLLFLIPFLIVLKISFSLTAIAQPPYTPVLDLGGGISGVIEAFKEFTVENYLELRAPADASGIQYETPAVWARHYPSEQVWFVRRN